MESRVCILLRPYLSLSIIYPDGPDISTEELNETIQFANENIVDPPEILSDHAYYYDRKQGRFVIP